MLTPRLPDLCTRSHKRPLQPGTTSTAVCHSLLMFAVHATICGTIVSDRLFGRHRHIVGAHMNSREGAALQKRLDLPVLRCGGGV